MITNRLSVGLAAALLVLVAPAARADLLRRLGRRDEARHAYDRALALARQGPERRFLQMRLAQL